jgi:cyclopropane fatty-acyl-phospholipid synthase-like methyltransferase
MKLDGSVTQNLKLALVSAKRLRGHPVYADTLSFWRELLHEARREQSRLMGESLAELNGLIESLEHELAERPALAGATF